MESKRRSSSGCSSGKGAAAAAAGGADDEQVVRKAFSKFDKNGDGTITREELAKILKSLDPEKYSDDARIEQMIEDADSDKDGVIDYMEFVDWVFKDEISRKLIEVVAEVSSSDEEP